MSTGNTSAQIVIHDPDIRLMLRVRNDDREAFAQLVQNYQTRMVGILRHIVGNAEEAEDLAQEVFLRVYRNRKTYQPTARFSTWLFTIANNLAMNALRNKSKKNATSIDSPSHLGEHPKADQLPDHGATPSFGMRQSELAEHVQRALDTLNERQKLAVVLNKFEDMSYAEIAEIMSLTTKAVKSLLCRARLRLRAALAGYIYMDGPPPGDDLPDEEAEDDNT
ncbi:MAG: sigma-70 family RNA polymerase sigma factor [Zavarzinella sp.]